MPISEWNTPASETEPNVGQADADQLNLPAEVSQALTAIRSVLAKGDAHTGSILLKEAGVDVPFDSDIALLRAKCKLLMQRALWLETSLNAMRQDFQHDRFSSGIGHFRGACCLSAGLPLLMAETGKQAAWQSKELLPSNWRVAEALLREATESNPAFKPARKLLAQLKDAQEDELILAAIYQADRAQFDGKVDQARQKLTDLLISYPRDERLLNRLETLNRRPEVPARAPDDLDLRQDPSAKDRQLSVIVPGSSAVIQKPKPATVVIPHSVWNSAKNFASLAATTAMLAVAGVLVWHHFTTTSPSARVSSGSMAQSRQHDPPIPKQPMPETPAVMTPVVAVPVVVLPDDEKAWQLIKTADDAASLRSFLATYPASAHALRARVKLTSMEWAAIDKRNRGLLVSFVKRHPSSPYKAEAERLILDAAPANAPAEQAVAMPSDRDAVLEAVRVYRRTMPEPLEQAAALVSSEPVIEGDKATVQVGATDGESTAGMTFALAKENGAWIVQSVR